MGGGRAEIGTPIAARGQHGHLGVEDVHRAVVQLPRDHALTNAIIAHQQINGEVFDEELGLLLQRLWP
jgi:hypothetical protein